MTILPGDSACLACLLESPENEASGLGVEDTCDTVGVLTRRSARIASLEAAELSSCLRKIGGAAPAADFLRCVGGDASIRCVSAKFRMPRVLRANSVSRRRAAAPHHPVRPRFRADPRDSRRLDLGALHARAWRPPFPACATTISSCAFRPAVRSHRLRPGCAIVKGTRDPAIARSLVARALHRRLNSSLSSSLKIPGAPHPEGRL